MPLITHKRYLQAKAQSINGGKEKGKKLMLPEQMVDCTKKKKPSHENELRITVSHKEKYIKDTRIIVHDYNSNLAGPRSFAFLTNVLDF